MKQASSRLPERPTPKNRLPRPRWTILFWQRRIAAAKTALFFIALEDTDGEAPVRAGLAEVVALLRGKEVGYDDLRAAVEHGTGKNLDASFRLWLYSKGIPQDFRDRYAADK